MRKLFWTWLLFGLAVYVSPARGGEEAAPALPVRLVIVGTSDFHGALEHSHAQVVGGRQVGGIDIIGAYIQAVRATHPGGVVLLDAGDLYQGTLLSAASEGRAVVEFYNDMGYDAAAVGNHDFDFGPVGYHSTPMTPEDDPLGVIKARIGEAQFPFLAGNIYDRATGKPVKWKNLRGYTLLERKGIRIGVIGLISPDTPLITHPANIGTLEFKPLLPTLRRLLPRVRSEGATVIVVVIHAGLAVDESTGKVTGAVADLARALKPGEVDLIVAGHKHIPFTDRVNDIPVIQPWSKGIAFVRADLVVDRSTGRVLQDHVVIHENTFFFRTDRNGEPPTYAGQVIRPLPCFVKKLKKFRRSIDHLERIRLGRATETMNCKALLDSPVGNLVTDAMRATDDSIDVAMYNSGGIRAPIPKGVITFGHVYEAVPFDNNLVKLTMTGAQIREVVEHGLAASYGVMEVSGLEVAFNPDAPPGARCVSILITRTGGELDDDKLYIVATNEFVLQGGDGYYAFSHGTNVQNTHTLIRELVARYIKEKGTVTPDKGGRYKPRRQSGEKKSH
jgi:5'-nucleotidase